MTISDPRQMLGSFIRAHRERLLPPVKSSGRRRTPGLRREELADACGVGLTWITWLEQGRDVSASAATLARLAEALQFTLAERASLFDLAGRRDPVVQTAVPVHISPDLLKLPSQFAMPAYVLDHTWTARAWNQQAASLLTGWLDEQSEERNLLNFVFLDPVAQTLIMDWQGRASRLVAEFRADYNRRPHDVAMQLLIDDLSERSPLFSQLWRQQLVLYREGGERGFAILAGVFSVLCKPPWSIPCNRKASWFAWFR